MTLDEEMVLLLDYYDREVVRLICNKYGYDPQVALHKFLASETYQMLRNPKLAMWEFSPIGIFDLWECEQITGNPKNSRYIRRD
jgi:hypothetical protein